MVAAIHPIHGCNTRDQRSRIKKRYNNIIDWKRNKNEEAIDIGSWTEANAQANYTTKALTR